MTRRVFGFTMVELVVSTLIVGICAMLILMPADVAAASEADAAGRQFAAMVEYAQSLAVARPDVSYCIRVDQAADRFWIALTSTPNTPLTHPITKQPFRVQLGSTSTAGLTAVHISEYSFGGDATLVFDSTGAIDQTEAASIAFGSGNGKSTVSLSASTGVISLKATLDVSTTGDGKTTVKVADEGLIAE